MKDIGSFIFKPQKQECKVCGDEYIGLRIVCEKKECFWALKSREAYNRSQRPIDYVPVPRRALIVDKEFDES
jgi:hypothetical protein